MLREAKVQPLCLVFEDLHWIDTETQALLDSMVESLPGVRVLLLVNYRPEYEHGWANKSYYTRLRLDPLSSEGSDELLAAILGGDSDLYPLKTLLIERTQGNPFYLEESVQTLVESGALAGGPGAYKLTEEVSKIEVPSTFRPSSPPGSTAYRPRTSGYFRPPPSSGRMCHIPSFRPSPGCPRRNCTGVFRPFRHRNSFMRQISSRSGSSPSSTP